MKGFSLDMRREAVKIVCLFILTVASVSSLTNSITSFAATKPAKAPVKIAQVKVVKPNNQKESVLTNAKGFALYFYTDDKDPKKPDCNVKTNKACTTAWPPVLFKGTLPAVPGLTSGLVLTKNTNGSQVTYQGHLLYTYKQDKKALVANGNLDGGESGKLRHLISRQLRNLHSLH